MTPNRPFESERLSSPDSYTASRGFWSTLCNRRIIASLVIALIVGLGVGYVIRQRSHENQRLARQSLLLRANDGDVDIESELQQLLIKTPGDVDVLRALLGLKLRGDDPVACDQLLQQWSNQEPGNLKPVQLRFEIACRTNNYSVAIRTGDQLLDHETERLPLLRKLIGLELAAGQVAEAARLAEIALTLAPHDSEVRLQRAHIYHQQGDHERAVSLLEKLLSEQPKSVDVKLLLGTIQQEQQRPRLAIPLLREVIKQDPTPRTRQVARYQLAQALFQLDEASETGEAERLMANWHRHEAARRLLVDAFQQPKNLELGIKAAQELFETEQEAEGLSVLDEILRQQPNHSMAHELLAKYFERHGDFQRAQMHRLRINRGS